ncbi:MAG: cobyric acid synthase [Promethearchaeota archaeon]
MLNTKTKARFLMVQGTMSDAGKSMIVMALCRIFKNMGFKVAPFKSQNMSLNSFVTKDGYEIARSQVVQSIAAGVAPDRRFNPILLKPKGDGESQIILDGKPFLDYHVSEYYSKIIPKLKGSIKKSIDSLASEYDLIIIEGAGSPAEINLMDHEIANMYIARLTDSPVILVGDIERGGVFAQILGTIKLLPKEDQNRIKGFIINKFRGDPKILEPGIKMLEDLIKIPCMGIVPFIEDLRIPAEDSMNLNITNRDRAEKPDVIINVIKLPHISNFNDFEPLQWTSNVLLEFISKPSEIHKDVNLIIIPGTKNTIKDLDWLNKTGFSAIIKRLAESRKAIILGICGGFQMLGNRIIDHAIEGKFIKEYPGLKLLNIKTVFSKYKKITRQRKGVIVGIPELRDLIVSGYEIHMGKVFKDELENTHELMDNEKEQTNLTQKLTAFIQISDDIDEKNQELTTESIKENEGLKFMDGFVSQDGHVIGTFFHGLFDVDRFRQEFLEYVLLKTKPSKKLKRTPARFETQMHISSFQQIVENNINKVVKVIKDSCSLREILKLIDF